MSDAPLGTDAEARAREGRPLLLCLSHLRWNFVFQRPQHLLTRAARDHDVVFFEEPVFKPGVPAPRLERHPVPEGVLVAVPVLPEAMEGDGAAVAAFRAAGAEGIVSAGFAPGFVTPDEAEALREAAAAGVVVVQSSRAGSGRVFPTTRLREAGQQP